MSVINTNITSMIGQQNLNKSQSSLQTSMERLSSGLRINSAKDDAAGQAIANRMSAQITGLAQSQRNANDGISISQTAEGALNQVNDNLQRVRELAVQAQNGTNSQDDLTSIQDEIGQRLAEIDRISGETNFNGTKVLASDQGVKIQVGANDGEAITVNLKEINAETLGLGTFNVDGKAEIANQNATRADLEAMVDGNFSNFSVTKAAATDEFDYTLTESNEIAGGAQILGALDENAVVTSGLTATEIGVNVTGGTVGDFTADGNGNFTTNITGVDTSTADAQFQVTNMVRGSGDGQQNAVYKLGSESAVNIQIDSSGNITERSSDPDVDGRQLYIDTTTGRLSANEGGTGVEATADRLITFMEGDNSTVGASTLALEGGPTLASTTAGDNIDINNIELTSSQLATYADDADEALVIAAQAEAFVGADFGLTGGAETTQIAVTIDADGEATFQTAAGGVSVNDNVFLNERTGDFTAQAEVVTNLVVQEDGVVTDQARTTQFYLDPETDGLTREASTAGDKTEDPLAALDAALNQVDSLRSELGAVQNRFESAITNLSTNETNLSAARSRIEDADYAVEVANMTRAQILQQAGTSVLAQANQIPQSVLSLLG